MALKKLGNEQGYLKAGFLGFQKSGKTYTSARLAIGTRKFFNLTGPVAFFDTESGSGYIAEMVQKETGTELMGVRARSFKELMAFGQDCISEKVSVAVVDSITHPWRELCDSYLAQVNSKRRERNFAPLQKLEFQHWDALKKLWNTWSDFFLNSPLHLIVCGRAGFEWDMETNDETGRKELVKTGIKMRVETEFGFESSLLVEMEREQIPDGQGGYKLRRKATVLGDRFSILDGKSCYDPTFEFFAPHVQMLKAGAHASVDTSSRTETGADIDGGLDYAREKKAQTILCEEIQGAIVSKIPGQSAEDKRRKADLLQEIFGTRSWTAVESLPSARLRACLVELKDKLGIAQVNVDADKMKDDLPEGAEAMAKATE